MRILISAIVLCTIVLNVYALQGVPTTEHYNNSLVLDKDGNYLLFWKNNITHVTFEVRVKTRGYVGFGLSPNGNMFPSDVVVGWVKNGKVYFKDRHTIGHSPPIADKSQDWFLLHGEENDFGTVLKFVRKINTCDSEDLVINNATQRLIFSYHPDDPTSEDNLGYHGGERRGTKSVNLLNVQKAPESVAFEEIKTYDVRAGNYIVPDKDTTYLCVGHQMPDLGGKHHMIEFEPIYTPGNEDLLHHVVIQRCPGNHAALHGAKGECFLNWPKGWPSCPEVFVAWATGGGPLFFPAHAGYPIGGPEDPTFLVMQLHYNNPTFKSGIIDNSGIRMRLTTTLRQHDIGSLVFGHHVNPIHVIPPHEPAFVTKGHCAEQCLRESMERNQRDDIRAIAVMHHAHLIGTSMKTRHFRNGTELKPLYDDPFYDFYFQEFSTLKDEVVIKKGDSMRVECTYKTTDRSEPTFGGLSTREEMCLTFVYYYPKTDLIGCESLPDLLKKYNTTRKDIWTEGPGSFRFNMKTAYDWSNSTEREQFKQEVENAPVLHTCSYNSHNASNPYGYDKWTFVEHESDHIQYTPPTDVCHTGH